MVDAKSIGPRIIRQIPQVDIKTGRLKRPKSKCSYQGGIVVDSYRHPSVQVLGSKRQVYSDFNQMARHCLLSTPASTVLSKLTQAGIKSGDKVLFNEYYIFGSRGAPGGTYRKPWAKSTSVRFCTGKILGFTYEPTSRLFSLLMRDKNATVSFVLGTHSASIYLDEQEVCTPEEVTLRFQHPPETRPTYQHLYGISTFTFAKVS